MTSYIVYVATAPWTTWSPTLPGARVYAGIPCVVTPCAYTLTGLAHGVTYHLALSAVSAAESPLSGQVSAEAQPSLLAIVWQGDAHDVVTNGVALDIFLARSTDHGETFSPPINISHNRGGSFGAQVGVSGSTVIVTWTDLTFENRNRVLFARSIDGGATFSSPELVSRVSGPVQEVLPAVYVAGNTVLIAWMSSSCLQDFCYNVFMARSSDGGATFSPPIQLSYAGHSLAPKIAATGRVVLVTLWSHKIRGMRHG